MEKATILPKDIIEKELQSLPGWHYKDEKISKEFKFTDFKDSLEFINQLLPFCEKNDHHPDVHIFYSKVLFELTRYDIGGKVTDKDFLVAREIERLYAARKK